MNNKWIRALLPPVVMLLIFSIFYTVCGIAPFGTKSIAWCDMEQQVIPLMLDLRDVLTGDGSMFYSGGNAGGMNMWGVYFFFVASPFSLLVCLVQESQMLTLMNLLVMVKLAVTAWSAGWYLRRRYPALRTSWMLLLSLTYGLCGYGLLYYQNLVWLDLLYLFPLLMLSLDALIRDGKMLGYICACSACVAVLYYLGFSIGIFLILYVGLQYYFISDQTRRRQIAFRFVYASGCALLITAVIWLPSLLQVMDSGRVGTTMQKLRETLVFKSIGDKLALLMCTTICLVPLFFLFGKRRASVTPHTKWMYLLLLIPVLLEPVNLLWHTGSYQCYPLRYGYITVLLGLSLVAEILTARPAPPPAQGRGHIRAAYVMVGILTLLTAAIVILCTRWYNTICSYTDTLWHSVSAFFLLLIPAVISLFGYYCGIRFYRDGLLSRRILTVSMSLLFALESCLNLSVYIARPAVEDTLYSQTLSLSELAEDPDYYRVRMERKYSHVNMIGAIGYNTIGHYTSLTASRTMQMMKKMGYSSYWMEIGTTGGTLLSDAILANRYIFGLEDEFAPWQTITANTDCGLSLARNQLCMPAGTVQSGDPALLTGMTGNDRIAGQKALAKAWLGTDSIISSYEPTKLSHATYEYTDGKHNVNVIDPQSADHSISYSFFVSGRQALYFDLFDTCEGAPITSDTYESVAVSINGHFVTLDYPEKKSNGILELGVAENQNVTVRVVLRHNISVSSFGVFGIDLDGMRQALEGINGADVTASGSEITASCTAEAPSYLYLSIPWDPGFTATVNGKPCEILTIDGCFMAIPVEAGENQIRLHFTPRGFKLGLAVTIAGLLAAAGYLLIRHIRRKKPPLAPEFVCRLMQAVFWCVLVVFYACTMILNIF